MQERDQIINFLLQRADELNGTIQGYQKKIAELEKELEQLKKNA